MNAVILKKEKVWPSTAKLIHEAIHNPLINEIVLPNENSMLMTYKVEIATNGCRKIRYNGINFIEQNKDKLDINGELSEYAILARQGRKITWGIRSSNWICIIDGEIKRK